MIYLETFENFDYNDKDLDNYEVVFLPSGVILNLNIDILWGDTSSQYDGDYDIVWNQKLGMYSSNDIHLNEIYDKIKNYNKFRN